MGLPVGDREGSARTGHPDFAMANFNAKMIHSQALLLSALPNPNFRAGKRFVAIRDKLLSGLVIEPAPWCANVR
jgi:hypothetical protein